MKKSFFKVLLGVTLSFNLFAGLPSAEEIFAKSLKDDGPRFTIITKTTLTFENGYTETTKYILSGEKITYQEIISSHTQSIITQGIKEGRCIDYKSEEVVFCIDEITIDTVKELEIRNS